MENWREGLRMSRTLERAQKDITTGAVVIDTGTGTCKAGFAGVETPQALLKTMVGYPTMKSMGMRADTFVGEHARLEGELHIISPLRNGVIMDWEAVEDLWRHLFYHNLKAAPEEHALLLSDPPLCPMTNREKLVEVVFESLNSPRMFVASESILSLYAHGKISGLVIDTGYATTYTVPIHQGYNLPHAVEWMNLAGANITSFLMDLLCKRGHCFHERTLAVVNDLKKKCCYVALDFEAEWNRPEEEYMVDYQLPDGQTIRLGKERFQCPEMLFHPPQMPGLSVPGVPGLALKSLQEVPEICQKEMYENILLCGGSSRFKGFKERLTHDLLAGVPTNTKVNVTTMPLRKYSVWTGGSILASLNNFQRYWVLKEEYQEYGPCIVHQKCY
ncbi:actin-like protein 9 [Pogona vitticeps]